MAGIQPLTGEFKELIEREAAEVRVGHILTISELEMQIKYLEGRLCIAEAKIQTLKKTNEALRDSICTRPLTTKRHWRMPESPECPHCLKATKPFARFSDDWILGFTCCHCDNDYSILERIEWPFEGYQMAYESDMERIGFLVS